MGQKRYFRAELAWVWGVCFRCRTTQKMVARVPYTRGTKRYCRPCLGRKRRLIPDREVA